MKEAEAELSDMKHHDQTGLASEVENMCDSVR